MVWRPCVAWPRLVETALDSAIDPHGAGERVVASMEGLLELLAVAPHALLRIVQAMARSDGGGAEEEGRHGQGRPLGNKVDGLVGGDGELSHASLLGVPIPDLGAVSGAPGRSIRREQWVSGGH
jgi:hypothetical protein